MKMAQELRALTINMKSLDQDIPDPIVAGAGDAAGRTLRIIFTQEAAAQFTPETKVYLSWHHEGKDISGLNVFKQISDNPNIWEIKYPQEMLFEGNVLACIKLVDSISIVQSLDFLIHVIKDPDDGSKFVVSDDYSVFQNAIIDLTSAAQAAKDQLEEQAAQFSAMQVTFEDILNRMENVEYKISIIENLSDETLNNLDNLSEIVEKTEDAVSTATMAYEKVIELQDKVTDKDNASGLYITEMK